MSTLFKILIEGVIGAGKSTICEATVKHGNGRAIMLEEKIEPALLELFYANPSQYAFCFQLHMLESRTNANALQMLRIETTPTNGLPRPSIALLDRCVLGDYVFAVANYLLGKINDEEMGVYTTRAGGKTIDDVGKILERTYGSEYDWQIVYLHSPAYQCKSRADSRGGVEAGAVPLTYYNMIEQIYFNVLWTLKKTAHERVFVVSWDQYQDTTRMAALLLGDISSDDLFDPKPPTSAEPVVQTTQVPDDVDSERMTKMCAHWYSDAYRADMFRRWSERTESVT